MRIPYHLSLLVRALTNNILVTTEDFVHRCGRTGRAGKDGKAITFFTGEAHERSLAGEFMRVLRDAGAEVPEEMNRFPSTIKKKEHGSYGAFYRVSFVYLRAPWSCLGKNAWLMEYFLHDCSRISRMRLQRKRLPLIDRLRDLVVLVKLVYMDV